MGILKKLFLHSPWRYVAAFIVSAAVTAAVLVAKGFDKSFFWYDALTTGGAVSALLGLLFLVARLGAFETMEYSFKRMAGRTRKDLFEYSQERAEKAGREGYTFMPFITVGFVFVIAGIIVRLFA